MSDALEPPPDQPGRSDEEQPDPEDLMERIHLIRVPSETLELLPHIPEVLNSTYEEGPFSRCTVCDSFLESTACIYYLEKVMRAGECVFEMAVCATCAVEMHREYSRESREALQRHYADLRLIPDIDTCDFCHKSSGPDQDRILTAACASNRLVMPVVINCQTCGERTQDLLSQKTRESFREFMENHIPGVPAEWEPAPPMVLG
jgi:hypothetical protein